MTPERFLRARELFEQAQPLPEAEQQALLAEQCGPDSELLTFVSGLLQRSREHESPNSLKRFQRVREIFEQAHFLPEAERPAFFLEKCRGDLKLGDAVDRLLAWAGADQEKLLKAEGWFAAADQDYAPVVVGCKMLDPDGFCDEDTFWYEMGKWYDTCDLGAWVAITGGLCSTSASTPRTIAYFECAGLIGPSDEDWEEGVYFYRYVRRIAPCLERIAPELRSEVAVEEPSLSAEQRIALAQSSTPDGRAYVAMEAPGLPIEQRIALARRSTRKGLGYFARYGNNIEPEQRVLLARESGYLAELLADDADLSDERRLQLALEALSPEERGNLACFGTKLNAELRIAIAEQSTHEWRCMTAHNAQGLSDEQRAALKRKAPN